MDLKIISAGAGSGKTYRLTKEMVELLASKKVKANGIIATTFTNKAAAELQERVRVKLLEEGLSQEANDLTNALIGTVHGLGVKLLKRFAYEAGVSPEVDIIADEDQQFLFNQSLAMVLTNERVAEMEQLSDRLGLNKSVFSSLDWRKVLKDLTEIARSNNFSKEVLEKSKTLSFQSFCEFLDEKKDCSEEEWNQQLNDELEQAISQLENNGDTTKVTATGVKTLKELQQELKLRKELYWHQWVKLSKIKVGTKSKDKLDSLVDFTQSVLGHHGLQRDVELFISNIFDISQKAIEEFNHYKKSRGLIDYTDMEVLVNELLKDDVVCESLQAELDLLMVDEFQDTSPLQLEIFMKLSKLAKHSIWVGDPKQSIYGFRGAEPALMKAIIEQQGGLKKDNILGDSWRSREDIVLATNAIFTKAFDEMPADHVTLNPKRCKRAKADSVNKDDEPASMGKALIHWHFEYAEEGRKPGRSWLDHCIAEQVKTTLERQPIILPKGEKEYRPIKPGDIAVLCRSNKACQEMADALHRAGLKAAISRAGLLNTAEAKLILACLKFILNKHDTLSVAEILVLAAASDIEDIIADRLDFLEKKEKGEATNRWGDNDPFIQQLNSIRTQVVELSSAEILSLLLEELELRRIIVAWGNPEQRLANVDVLIKWSFQYEEACNRLHSAASLGGFLLWLNDLENNGDDLQGAGENEQAVNVLTYHKSKGLEYPVVICHSLDQQLREDVWGLSIVPESTEVDLDNLLGNRWLRFWVNPFADQYQNTLLSERIDASSAKAKKRKEAMEEEARLLYVGITRARDYLVLPTYHKPPIWLNRVYFQGKEDQPVLNPSSDISILEWVGEELIFQIEVVHFPADFAPRLVEEQATEILSPPLGKANHRIYKIEELTVPPKLELKTFQYSSPLNLPEVIERQLVGKALVAFFKAAKQGLDKNVQREIAAQLININDVESLVEPDQFIFMADQFENWLAAEQPIKRYANYPVKAIFNDQLFEATIDLILETKNGLVMISHSPFVGEGKSVLKKSKEMAGRLIAQKKAVEEFFGIANVRVYSHFVLAGTLIAIE
ncbi:MAG: UvrD-helicase domain-containing protein [Saprospiraceae bacterium]